MLREVRDRLQSEQITSKPNSLLQITNNIVNPAHFDGQVHPKRLSIGLRSTTAIQAEEAAEPLANALAEEMFSLDRDRQFEEAILAREFAEAEVVHSHLDGDRG